MQSDAKEKTMKNTTFSIEEITKLENMTKEELITSYKQYSSYTDNNLALLTNISTLDKAVYIGIMLKSMKAKEICEKTSLTKSHVSRLGKVGKWALNNKEQYQKLINTAGTSLSVRAIADAITHDTIKGVDDWASLIRAEENYKASTKTTPKAKAEPSAKTSDKKTASNKPASDKAEPAKPKNPSYRINDFERMNSTSVYQAIMRMINAYCDSNDNIEYLNSFIERLDVLKH